MLKTNSKQAREAFKNYIINSYDGSNYEPGTPEADAATLAEIATVILNDVKRVNGCDVERGRGRYTWQDAFRDWSQSLPGLLDTCYHYNVCAVDLLGNILQETPAEKARFTENDAERMLDNLIYRELVKAAPHVLR